MTQSFNESNFASKIRQEISDITECPICTETLKDPRNLPCLHIFCLVCLKCYGNNKKAGDTINCPLCRKAFTLNKGGFESLPVNHFINKVIEIGAVHPYEHTEQFCEFCSSTGMEESAVGYCIECREHLCDGCFKRHGIQKSSKTHKTVTLEKKPGAEELMKMSINYCDRHEGEANKLYCYNCKKTVCVICFVSNHKEHKCTDINQAVIDLIQSVDVGEKSRQKLTKETTEILDQVKLAKEDLTIMGAKARASLAFKYNELQEQLDLHFIQSTDKVTEMENKRKTELKVIEDECENELAAINDLHKFWEEVKSKGTPCDISETAESVRERKAELSSLHEKKMDDWKRRSRREHFEIKFTPSTIQRESLLGELMENSHQTSQISADWERFLERGATTEIHPLTVVQEIGGMAVNGDNLFIIQPNSAFVYMYDLRNPQTAAINIQLPAQAKPIDIVCCNASGFLYLSSNYQAESGNIYRINLKSQLLQAYKTSRNYSAKGYIDCRKMATKDEEIDFLLYWTTKMGIPISLSVTSQRSILVTAISHETNDERVLVKSGRRGGRGRGFSSMRSWGQNQYFENDRDEGKVQSWIQEYNCDGVLLKVVQIGLLIDHAIGLSNGTYAVYSSFPEVRVSIVEKNKITASYCRDELTHDGVMNFCIRLNRNEYKSAVRIVEDKLQRLLVFDPTMNHVYVLNSQMELKGFICDFESNYYHASPVFCEGELEHYEMYGSAKQSRCRSQFEIACFCCWDDLKKRIILGSPDGTIQAIVPA